MLNKIILISIVAGFLFCNPASAYIDDSSDNVEYKGVSLGYSSIHIGVIDYYTNSFAGWISRENSYLNFDTDNYNQECLVTIREDFSVNTAETTTYTLHAYRIAGVGFTTLSSYYNPRLYYTDLSYLVGENPVIHTSTINELHFSCDFIGTVNKSIEYITFYESGHNYANRRAYFSEKTPTSYISWDTFPSNSWKVGNYSTLMVGVPASLKNFTFFYKTPSTDYTEMPIQKHFIHKTFNVEEGEFYYYYAKFPYHATYGTYSAKIELNEVVLDSKSVIVPYFDPDITLPDTIIIPIPAVFVDPPQWNVTVPPEYENVTWLTDYTAFCDGIGNSLNYTTYATIGLLLIPLDMLNGSVTTIHEYATDAAGMVTGFEHCSIMIKVAWAIIPSEIQTLFVGAAALGLVVFLYHRRA